MFVAMRKIPLLTWILILIGIVLVVVAIVYFSSKADNLPSFFPGHTAPSPRSGTYTKRGLAALVVAVIVFGAAFFTSPFSPSRRKG